MTRYTVLRLFVPNSPPALSDGHYDVVARDVDARPENVPNGTIYVDQTTGETWQGPGQIPGDLFDALGFGDLGAGLTGPGHDVAILDYDRDVLTLLSLATVGDGQRLTVLGETHLFQSVGRAEIVELLLMTLSALAEQNRRTVGDGEIQGFAMRFSSLIRTMRILRTDPIVVGQRYRIDYTNYEGRRSTREIAVTGFAFGSNAFHTTPGLMIEAVDVARGVARTFTTDARARIHAIVPVRD